MRFHEVCPAAKLNCGEAATSQVHRAFYESYCRSPKYFVLLHKENSCFKQILGTTEKKEQKQNERQQRQNIRKITTAAKTEQTEKPQSSKEATVIENWNESTDTQNLKPITK